MMSAPLRLTASVSTTYLGSPMSWGFRRHSNTTIDRTASAFPADCANDVTEALRVFPVEDDEPTSDEGIELYASGEHLRIPSRVHFEQPSPAALELLNPVRRLIVAALLTRHHDGHVRERWLGELLPSPVAWAPAFVVPLLGEYVVEILSAVRRGLPRTAAEYEVFARNNPEFCRKTSARMVNYWALYYRHAYPRFRDYPGYQVAKTLNVWIGQPPRDRRAR
jgi:hypothetical protein